MPLRLSYEAKKGQIKVLLNFLQKIAEVQKAEPFGRSPQRAKSPPPSPRGRTKNATKYSFRDGATRWSFPTRQGTLFIADGTVKTVQGNGGHNLVPTVNCYLSNISLTGMTKIWEGAVR